ncbi:uncharacterized protein isoform X1 [Musca autumnalis]|uniref:uncharacterized protein isoform X1 n=1 Tax=Musca autumnalis TaxID=221902 RepID=UPI003CFB8028
MPKDDIEVEENASGSDLASLKQQRSLIKKNITNIQKKVEKDGSKMDSTILECRLEILEEYFKQLCTIQSQIETINTNDNGRSDLEETFIVAKAKILKLINKNRGSVAVDNSLMNVSMACGSSSRLPSLKLPNFDGKYSEYKRFITAFNNMVHENQSISIIEKFNYLLNCLSGPALAVVEPYQVCEDNYEKALQRLQERYDNKVLIFLEHIESLFNVPKMQTSDSVSLRHIIDTVSAVRGSLLSLGSEADVMNAILVHMVLTKVDNETKDNYDEKQDFKSLPSWDLCYELLSRRCQFLESHRKRTEIVENVISNKPKSPKFNRSAHTFVNSKSNCSYCNSSEHNLSTCSSFANIVVSERFNFVKRSGHCINCLRKGHMVSNCPSKYRCRVCDSAHHTILHIFSSPEQPSTSNSNGNSPQPSTSSNPVSFVARSFRRAVIPTAVILMKDNCGSFHTVRALLDSCSELNFISEETAKRLKLKFRPFSQEISGIAEVRTAIKFSVDTTIKSRSSSFESSSSFAVTKTISSCQPDELMNTSQWKIPQNIELADPLFYKPQRIDVLLSAEIFFDLLLDGRISLGNGLPHLTNTVFGWIVGGSSPSRPSSRSLTCNLIVSTREQNIDKTLKQIWEVEEYSKSSTPCNEEEQACEDHFVANSRFDSYGRVQVRLPFKKLPYCLGNSFEIARKGFLSLERRLERDSTLKSMYEAIMQEYVSLGHMSPYNLSSNNSHYIIPQHCFLKPHSSSSELRVVFDGFVHTSSNHSLNDTLVVGPTTQPDLVITLFSFRWNKYALTADVLNMYRQFRIGEPDRRLQIVLWISYKDDYIKVSQLNTVNNGLSAAPFFANRISFLITDKDSKFHPSGSEVDDVLTGSDIIETLALKGDELLQILKLNVIELAERNSNHASLISNDDEEIIIKALDNEIPKAWKPLLDVYLCSFVLSDIKNTTKLSIPSLVFKNQRLSWDFKSSKVAASQAQSLIRRAVMFLNKTWLKSKYKTVYFVLSSLFWSDSKIVLQWLKLNSSILNCFVANHVTKLRERTRNMFWKHVQARINPAVVVFRDRCIPETSILIWDRRCSFIQDGSNCLDIGDEFTIESSEYGIYLVLQNTIRGNNVSQDIMDKHFSYLNCIGIIFFVFYVINRCPKPIVVAHMIPNQLEVTIWKYISLVQLPCFAFHMFGLPESNLHQTLLRKIGGLPSNAPSRYDESVIKQLQIVHSLAYTEYSNTKVEVPLSPNPQFSLTITGCLNHR